MLLPLVLLLLLEAAGTPPPLRILGFKEILVNTLNTPLGVPN